jgi:hypothetical protein
MEHGMVRIEKFSIFFGAVGLEYWLDTVFRISIPYLGQGCFPVMPWVFVLSPVVSPLNQGIR